MKKVKPRILENDIYTILKTYYYDNYSKEPYYKNCTRKIAEYIKEYYQEK